MTRVGCPGDTPFFHGRAAAERPVRWTAELTIQDWGSIGEVVAAAATVATLIYLTIQIRANTVALRMESRRAESLFGDVYFSAIIGSSDVARVFNQGLADPTSLSPEDATRFSFLMGRIIGAEATAFDEVRFGFLGPPALERRRQTLRRFVASPGGRWFWARFAGEYSPEFRADVEEVLGNSMPAA